VYAGMGQFKTIVQLFFDAVIFKWTFLPMQLVGGSIVVVANAIKFGLKFLGMGFFASIIDKMKKTKKINGTNSFDKD
jgi:hypothetical protein